MIIDLLASPLGAYDYSFRMIVYTTIDTLICTALYSRYFSRKQHFLIRLLLCLLSLYAITVLSAFIRGDYDFIWVRLLIRQFTNLFIISILFFCFNESVSELLLCWSASLATQSIAEKSFGLILNLFAKDDRETISFFSSHQKYDWYIYYATHIAIYLILVISFNRHNRTEKDKETTRNIVYLSVGTAILTNILMGIERYYEGDNYVLNAITKIFSILCGLFILLLRTDILTQNRYKQELKVMNEVLHLENKQFEAIKENINVINTKCHDIRNQLSRFEGRLTDQELDTLKAAIHIYDNNIKTGCEILDVILYQKQLYCEKNQIQLSCMADGSCLSFMSPAHLHSLFSNAIENAIEALTKLEDTQKRIVNISIHRQNGLITISISNYFTGECPMADYLPVTSKEDKNHHGYGMRSMKYIAEQYNGSLFAKTDGEVFHLNIHIPAPD